MKMKKAVRNVSFLPASAYVSSFSGLHCRNLAGVVSPRSVCDINRTRAEQGEGRQDCSFGRMQEGTSKPGEEQIELEDAGSDII
jgi:hypothetical protein